MRIVSARWVAQPPPSLHGRDRKSAAQAAGLRYEARVQTYLLQRYGDTYVPSPWFAYRKGGDYYDRYCQPDGLLFDLDRGKIVVVEVKIRHCPRAAEQLLGLYRPVLASLFDGRLWSLGVCEVTRWFDKDIPFPVPVSFRSMPDEVEPGEFGVIIHRART